MGSKWWPPIRLDRRAYWLSVGCSEEETATKMRMTSLTFAAVVVSTSLALGATQLVEVEASAAEFSRGRTALAVTNAIAVTAAWAIDTLGTPPPGQGSDPQVVTSTIGPLAYFTKQSLCIQLTHSWLSALAEAFVADPPFPALLPLVHLVACPVAVVAFSLTLLFLKLNWFEATWRQEILYPWLQRGVPMDVIMLVCHIVSLPAAVVDVALVKRPHLLGSSSAVARRSVLVVLAYITFYISLTNLNFRWTGRYPYPFMRDLTTPARWALFALALVLLLNSVILPAVLLAKTLNRDFL